VLGALLVIAFAFLGFVAFGIGLLRPAIENRLSASLDRTVTIGAIRREGAPSLWPRLVFEDVRIAQPDWAKGDMVHIRAARVRLPLLPLLVGRANPERVDVDGLQVHLIRRDSAHSSWKAFGHGSGGGGGPDLISIRDGNVRFDDAKRDHYLTGTLSADEKGFRLVAAGTLKGQPARGLLRGAPLAGRKPWPFRLDYRSPIANAILVGRADGPLDVGHFEGDARAWGDDLRDIDQLIEAGLPGTRPARLTAHVTHDGPDWKIERLDLSVGRSHATGRIDVRKRDDRTQLDGALVADALDFDDLANATGRARAAAKEAAAGLRVLPDTAIDLSHMMRTDGRLTVDVKRLLVAKPSPVRTLKTVLTLDHGVLTADPLTATLDRGTVSGTLRVDQRAGPTRLHLDLRLSGAETSDLFGSDAVSGPLDARILLDGPGPTIRAAIGKSTGRFAIVVRNGTISRRAALFLGTDIGRALFENKEDRTTLRCIIAGFTVAGGTARPSPLLFDSAVARMDGTGTLDLASERIALDLHGQPKLANAVPVGKPIQVAGTLSAPELVPPDVPKTVGTVIKMIGKAIAGDAAPPAPDADCAGAAARALR